MAAGKRFSLQMRIYPSSVMKTAFSVRLCLEDGNQNLGKCGKWQYDGFDKGKVIKRCKENCRK